MTAPPRVERRSATVVDQLERLRDAPVAVSPKLRQRIIEQLDHLGAFDTPAPQK